MAVPVAPASPAPFHLGAYSVHGDAPSVEVRQRRPGGRQVVLGKVRDREAAVAWAYRLHQQATATTARMPAVGARS